MRRINQALWYIAAAMYPVTVVVPTVTGIVSTAQTEGTAITHTVSLSAAVAGAPAVLAFAITAITASAGSDYTATPTFGSSGVTLSGGYLSVPIGTTSFPIVVATSQDTNYEGTESYSITVAGVTNTVNINDDDSAPTVLSVSSASGYEGYSVIHTVTITGTAQGATSFALSLSGGTATAGVDYTSTLTNSHFSAGVTISGGNISVPSGVTSFQVFVPALTDALTEGNETYTLTIGGASGTGTVSDPVVVGSVTYGAPADAGQVNDSDTLAGGANRYWVNSSTGLNTNTGLLQASPIQYLDKVGDYAGTGGTYGVTAPPSSQFVLARGTTYDGFLLANTISAAPPYVFYGDFQFGASGTGARPKILFKNSPALNNSNNSGLMANNSGTKVKNIDLDMQFCFAVTVNTVNGTFVDGDVLTCGAAQGIFHYNQSGNWTIECTTFPVMFNTGDVVTASGGRYATLGVAITAEIAPCTGMTAKNSNQEFRNGSIMNALGIGLLISSNPPSSIYADNLVIDGMTISNACLTQTNGAGIDGGGNAARPVENLTITHNTIVDCGEANSSRNHNMYFNDINNSYIAYNWSYMTQNRGSFGLILHGNCNNDIIEYNLFEYCGNGVGINDGYATTESFTNITFRNNINRFHGQRAGQLQGIAMYLFGLVNCNVYNNLHYGSKMSYFFAAVGPSGGGDSVASGNVFSHETLYNNAGGMVVTGTMGATTNVFQNFIIASTAITGTLLSVDAAAYPKTVIRNFLIWAPNNTASNAIVWNGTNYTLDNWMTAVGTGLGCIKADPLFTDAANGDFTLQAGSPCKLAGYNSGITTDFAGNARHATTPSIGAYE